MTKDPSSEGQSAQPQNLQNEAQDVPQDASLLQTVLQQAGAAAASSVSAETLHELDTIPLPPVEDVPPPPYSAGRYGEVDLQQHGFDTGARVASDGRVDMKIDQVNRRLTHMLTRQFTHQGPEPHIPEGLGTTGGLPCPPLNIVIQVVGSRGDVQPFIALGQVLKHKFNHRVRLATHPVFKDFVTENGLEFFSIGGDPADLMAFMVKNPGLLPGVEALKSGAIGKKRKDIYEMINGCWRSCIEPGDGSGPPVSDAAIASSDSLDTFCRLGDMSQRPFVADAIIANPPSFAHIHVAEKLGIPLHLMFTMPWSPTQAYPHPLANILSSNTDQGMANFISYVLVDLLTWQGLGDVINRFREKTLRLEPISIIWAPGSLHRLRIPWTYAWSPALIPKPSDWPGFIDVSGFFFLDLATNYTPADDLATFLAAGKPPVYIGFGSIVVDDPDAMTKTIFEAVKLTGHRALVSKGWGGLSAGELGQPEDVFMLGNCPHDWLFQRVSAVVHHGGAGTTAAGVKAGRPTVIIPFFGDQPFWGNMVHRAGAGPKPIPYKELTAQKLADAILEALKPESLDRAAELSAKIQNEDGPNDGANSFHKFLEVDQLRCSIAPGRAAVWRIKRTDIRLSTLAATVLANSNLIDFSDLKLYRPREYEVDTGPPEPLSGGAAAIIGSIGSVTASVADFPSEVLRGVRTTSGDMKKKSKSPSTSSPPVPSSKQSSSSHLPLASPGEDVAVSSMSNFSLRSPDASTAASVVSEDERHTVTPPSTIGASVDDHKSILSTDEELPRTNTRQERSSMRESLRNTSRRSSSQEAAKITLGTAIGSAKAAGNIVAIGMKSPLDFTMSLAKGFHNLPRLYNDTTVRPTEKVTGFQSGLRAAGKTFAYGFMDGIGGLVTQPMQGYKEEGGAGLVKGFMKGSFGLVAKPGAAIWGLPAYTMQGIYAEISKNFGRNTTNYIIAARMAQGYEEYHKSGEGERERIVVAWHSPELQDRYKRKPVAKQSTKPTQARSTEPGSSADRLYDAQGRLLSGFFNTMHLTFDERKELARLKQEQQQQNPQTVPQEVPSGNYTTASDADFRDAIREAVQRTSTNDPREDQAIENAIWASVRELQRTGSEHRTPAVAETGTDRQEQNDEDAYQRAIAASVAEYKRSQQTGNDVGKDGQKSAPLKSNKGIYNEEYEDDELTRAITASLEEYSRGIDVSDTAVEDRTPTGDDDDDEDYKRALAESLKHHASSTSQTDTIKGVAPALPPREIQPPPPTVPSPAIHTSSSGNDNDENDADLSRAIRMSEQEHSQRATDLEKQKTEEDIVMEYVKKQSLAEEEYRKSKNV